MSEVLDQAELDRLGNWMDSQDLPGAGEAITSTPVSGGSQNVIYRIQRGPLDCAMRKPPKDAPEGRDEGILREWRIIEALNGSDVPHTEAIAACTDTSVLGCTFYLMGFVDGWSAVGRSMWPSPFDEDLDARRGLAFQLVDGVAKMSKFDWRANGLGDMGRPDGYHERQVERWLRFYGRVQTRDIPGLDVASDWLGAHKPIDYVPGLMHGDYQFANVMYHHGAPARLAAIIDWEMGTIGDPKIDLGWVLQMWPDDMSQGPESSGAGYPPIEGMPDKGELLDHFRAETGRQVDDIDYYLVLARWKLGIVLEQGYMRVMRGEGDEKQKNFGPLVLDLIKRAADLAETTDYR